MEYSFSDHAFGLQTSFVNRPSLWMRNKSPLKLKYSPVKLRAENFNWMGLIETMLAFVGLSDPGRPIMAGFLTFPLEEDRLSGRKRVAKLPITIPAANKVEIGWLGHGARRGEWGERQKESCDSRYGMANFESHFDHPIPSSAPDRMEHAGIEKSINCFTADGDRAASRVHVCLSIDGVKFAGSV
ncbi:MAG: hypothetical protein WBE80_08830 [Methylocella sp.]